MLRRAKGRALGSCFFGKGRAPRLLLREKSRCSEFVASGRVVRLGLIVEGEEQAFRAYVVEFSLQLHIPNSTGSFKLDR
jgi:hypothetical protein